MASLARGTTVVALILTAASRTWRTAPSVSHGEVAIREGSGSPRVGSIFRTIPSCLIRTSRYPTVSGPIGGSSIGAVPGCVGGSFAGVGSGAGGTMGALSGGSSIGRFPGSVSGSGGGTGFGLGRGAAASIGFVLGSSASGAVGSPAAMFPIKRISA